MGFKIKKKVIIIKEWIKFFAPILLNGLIVLIIQILFESKKIKRNEKLPVFKELSKKAKEFNNSFIDENIKIFSKETDISLSLNLYQNYIIEMIKIYDANKLYLKKVKKEIDELQNSWYFFKNILNNIKFPISNDDSNLLAINLNNVKKELENLIEKLDKYIIKV